MFECCFEQGVLRFEIWLKLTVSGLFKFLKFEILIEWVDLKHMWSTVLFLRKILFQYFEQGITVILDFVKHDDDAQTHKNKSTMERWLDITEVYSDDDGSCKFITINNKYLHLRLNILHASIIWVYWPSSRTEKETETEIETDHSSWHRIRSRNGAFIIPK